MTRPDQQPASFLPGQPVSYRPNLDRMAFDAIVTAREPDGYHYAIVWQGATGARRYAEAHIPARWLAPRATCQDTSTAH